jgi:acyl transferase domain-containing protein/aryl carrier-like protein
LSPRDTDWLREIGALSSQGRCATFDERADGYVRSEGCGVVVLKPLAHAQRDGDPILGTIRGTAVGHGGASGGITVPNGPAQQDVIRRALADAGAQPDEVGFVECHGTGTSLGDPIEVGALGAVFGPRDTPLVLGAIKTQIGHAETAAGIAGVLKALVVLKTGQAPANLHMRTPNPKLMLNFGAILPTEPTPVAGLAGVSSFGISGTNAHIVLAGPQPTLVVSPNRSAWLLPLSADDPDGVSEQAQRVSEHLTDLPAVARTLTIGRPSRPHRQAVVATDRDHAQGLLRDPHAGYRGHARPGRPPRVGWLFTGQGAQAPGMGLALDASLPAFSRALDRVDKAFGPHLDRPLRDLLADENVHQTHLAQPALFAVGWALAEVFQGLGARPAGMVGHSLGEYTAACVAGVFSLEDAAAVVAARGRAMAAQPSGGAMVAIQTTEALVLQVLADHPGVEIAAINTPNDVVITGPADVVNAAAKALREAGAETSSLTVSHAFHSEAMQGALPAIREALTGVSLSKPTLTVYSNLDGRPLGHRATDPENWTAQTRRAVRFSDAVTSLARDCDVLLELGPHPVLLGLAGRALGADGPELIPTFTRGEDQLAGLLSAAGRLWTRDPSIDLSTLVPSAPVASLPTTAWRRQRHWVQSTLERNIDDRPASMFTLEAGTQRPELASVDIRVGPNDDPAQVIGSIANLAAGTKRLVIEANGAYGLDAGAVTPAVAATVGLVATLAVERPDLDVLLVDGTAPAGARWVKTAAPAAAAPGGVWLVSGASGALGRRVARWLADEGASQVICVSRNPPERAMLDQLGDGPFTWVAADIGERTGADVALGTASANLSGAVHCAGVNRPGLLADIDPADVEAVLHGKLGGAQHLAAALPKDARLILFGSATSWLGLPGQGVYAAANAALDAIALSRPGPTTAISWGPWQAGMAANSGVDWHAAGVQPLSDARALATLGSLLSASAPRRVVAIDIDPQQFVAHRGAALALGGLVHPTNAPANAARSTLRALVPAARKAWVSDRIIRAAERVLGHPPHDGQGFFDAGMDSLGAVELSRALGRLLDLPLPPTVAFDHPQPAALADHLLARLALDVVISEAPRTSVASDEPIAVIGLACRFPGAEDADALWRLLLSGGDALSDVPADRWDAAAWFDADRSRADRMYTTAGGFLSEIDRFDPELFGIAPREAERIDPQQRLLLETCWRALDDAHQLSEHQPRTGVFVGVAERGWLRRFEAPAQAHYADAWAGTGSEASFAAGRVSHALGLRGPAIALNTTCSSALVAMHLAAAALRRGDCDTALAGGVHLVLDPESTAYLCTLGALSPTGRCHTFDAAADGYVRGEGCGILVLKPLSTAQRDGDPIRAILRGSAINHDGHASGLTAPSGPAQTDVIRRALDDAGVQPQDVGWLQAHGTGTPLGDPIEISAAAEVFGRAGQLPIGTVKTAIGHCELAAGAAGAIAAILAVERGVRPPHPIDRINPDLDLTGFVLPDQPMPWPATNRVAGVSAFGLSGTNAHLIFASGPKTTAPAEAPPVVWLPVAAHDPDVFDDLGSRLSKASPSVLAAALHTRAHLPWRSAVVCPVDGVESALQGLHPVRRGSTPRVALLFTGQGSQWMGMHRAWAHLPAFQQALTEVGEALDAHLDRPLATVLEDAHGLGLTQNTQPALFAVGVALAAQWRAWGVEPVAVAGHSIGELAAAAVSGALSIVDAAALVAQRGKMMGALPAGGTMAVVKTGEATLSEFLDDTVVIAGVNDPGETVIAGLSDAVEPVLVRIEAAGHEVQRLKVSHAFHSHLLDPMLDAWEAVARHATWRTPQIPLVSTTTGQLLTDADAKYWRGQARNPVRFRDAMATLSGMGVDAFIECGPHPILIAMGQRTVADSASGLWLGSMRRGDVDATEGLRSLGRYWERGGHVNFEGVQPTSHARLPEYPMRRRALWPSGDRYRSPSWTFTERWLPSPWPDASDIQTWTVLGSSPLADALATQLSANRSMEALAQGVIDCRPLDGGDAAALMADADTLARLAIPAGSAVWWITRGGVGDRPSVHPAALWGWARCAFAEHPGLRGGCIDVIDSDAAHVIRALGAEEAALVDNALSRPRLQPAPMQTNAADISGTWLLTGGLGGLGRRVARWLADAGATRLLLTARTPLPDRSSWPDATGEMAARVALVKHLEGAGTDVGVGAFDAGDMAALAQFLTDETLTGVVHLAGSTDPQRLLDADPDRQRAVLSSKLDGAVALDAWTRENPVQHLVFFGSIAAAWGSRELGAYAAANSAVDAIARTRTADGLPGVCVGWGPWGGGGMVDDQRAQQLTRMGQRLVDPQAALDLLGRALSADQASLIAARVDWARFLTLAEASAPWARFDDLRPTGAVAIKTASATAAPPKDPAQQAAWLEGTLARLAHQVLRLEHGRDIDPQQPLMELGFDSLMATELNNALVAEGIDVPLGRLLGGPSLEELQIMAAARLQPQAPPSGAEVTPTLDPEGIEPIVLWMMLASFIAGAGVATAVVWAMLSSGAG